MRSARATRSLDGLLLVSLDVVPLALDERLSDAAVELLVLLGFASLLMLPRFASVLVLAGGFVLLELGAGVVWVVLLLGLLP